MKNMKSLDNQFTEIISKIQDELSSGFLYTHTRINYNTTKTLESTSFLYALIELLNEKGLITIKELDERKKQVAQRLVNKFTEMGLGLMYQDPEYDKYNFQNETFVDCQSRLDVCKASCCKLPFALSRQDVEENIIRWEFGRPYLISHGTDGYCVHLNSKTYLCTVHENRPVPCRGFDCRDNKKWKIWLDYDKKVIAPDLSEQLKRSNDQFYNAQKSSNHTPRRPNFQR